MGSEWELCSEAPFLWKIASCEEYLNQLWEPEGDRIGEYRVCLPWEILLVLWFCYDCCSEFCSSSNVSECGAVPSVAWLGESHRFLVDLTLHNCQFLLWLRPGHCTLWSGHMTLQDLNKSIFLRLLWVGQEEEPLAIPLFLLWNCFKQNKSICLLIILNLSLGLDQAGKLL